MHKHASLNSLHARSGRLADGLTKHADGSSASTRMRDSNPAARASLGPLSCAARMPAVGNDGET